MSEIQATLPLLPYRALTGTDEQLLAKRVKDALDNDGYRLLGELSSASDGNTIMYVQAVISPTVPTFVANADERFLSIPHKGGTDRPFCEAISCLVDSGDWQFEETHGPVVTSIGGQWQLTQKIIPRPPR
ncbi:MAG: DUF1737 domain-containing protein [Candidatus Pacebacteria bacterium]|nr:DUF1737 domain-containing protein [Candidatus Paceibacterota bacterium]MBP9842445.1 DUF1737 domain-containing protein [Candidatus Paceibacterota bacterium]